MKYDAERIRDLYAAGRSYEYITAVMGCSVSVVTRALRDDGEDQDGIDDLTGDRCRCGLRLPCNSCISGQELLYARTSHTLPASPDIDHNEINEACNRFMERHGH